MKLSLRKLSVSAVLTALALILSFVESQIPVFLPLPGAKVGLANIVTLFALYRLGIGYAVAVQAVRVSLSSILFGSFASFVYALSGAALSLCLMILVRLLPRISKITVSIVGGVSHNIAQIAAASLMLGTNAVAYYLPFLLITGTVAGTVIGVAGALLINKIPRFVI